MAETEKQKKARLLNAAKRKQRQQEYARIQAKVKGVESKGGATTYLQKDKPSDVSPTGQTGPSAAPNLKVSGGKFGSKRKTPPTLRVPSKGRRKHPRGAIAVNDEGDYQYGDVYHKYMKDDGYRRI